MSLVLLAIVVIVLGVVIASAFSSMHLRADIRDVRAQLDDVAVLARVTAARDDPAPGEIDEPSRVVRVLFREQIVVTLKTGETFAGVLVAADAHALMLREAVQLATADRAAIDGELIVPRVDIAYLQRP